MYTDGKIIKKSMEETRREMTSKSEGELRLVSGNLKRSNGDNLFLNKISFNCITGFIGFSTLTCLTKIFLLKEIHTGKNH